MKSNVISTLSLRLVQVLMFCAVVGTTFLGTAVFSSPEAQAGTEMVEFRNYLGDDGHWHYVHVYRDNVTNAEWSSEWIEGHGPFRHNPGDLFPHYIPRKKVGGGDVTDPWGGMKYTPINLYCEYMATAEGVINLETDEDNVYIEISDLQGSVFMKRTLLNKGSNSIKAPTGFSDKYPYGITFYRGEGPVWTDMFRFDGARHHTQKVLEGAEAYRDTKVLEGNLLKPVKAGE